VITWNSRTLYEDPTTGVCEITGEYETGRFYLVDGSRRIFIGNSAAPEHVEDYAGFLAATGTVQEFKAAYPKRERIAERIAPKKKKK
jgi:hypothetical protein